MEKISENKVFDGIHQRYKHESKVNNCTMQFAIYLPPQSNSKPVPVMYWLSGLTCTDENFMQKAGALRIAAQLGIAIVAPDTSPRGDGVADDDNQSYDFGLGAGFYVNATQAPWSTHYNMYDYVMHELPALVQQHFPVNKQRVISGHSMGGHGALVMAIKNPHVFSSVTAFSAICHPVDCPWGKKAFSHYLGSDKKMWEAYDASLLIANSTLTLPMLLEQGSNDDFMNEQLKPQCLVKAAHDNDYPLTYSLVQGYDHSYYFIASFIEKHMLFHAESLGLITTANK